MDFQELITSRQSIRSFSQQALSDEVILEMQQAARLAPSWQNKQCWRFVFVDDKALIRQLALHSGLLSKANFFIKDAPLVVVACAYPEQSGKLNQQDYYLVDTAIAFQQMMLAAWNKGVGSCWLGSFHFDKVRQILDIPSDVKIVALSPFGYPAAKTKIYDKMIKKIAKSKQRKARAEIFCQNSWNF